MTDDRFALLRREIANRVAERDALAERADALTAALRKVDELLTDLQPKILEACKPGYEAFIDAYVDPALEIVRKALAAPSAPAAGGAEG